ncbi:MAG: hypothetical protein ACR652_00625 [Methylocystis sp.]|uniref:hypothetical protein n=1 Tax=Methylocystis sp. TaxID=1911079 RepID=UPI003DA2F9F0
MSKSQRPLSPIERAIDAACGYKPTDDVAPSQVWLECPQCGRKQRVARDETDPPSAYRVRFSCPKCRDEARIVEYFDAQGRKIDCDGNISEEGR